MSPDDEGLTNAPEPKDVPFVAVAFARSLEEAKAYQELLGDHDIPAQIGNDEDFEDSDSKQARQARLRGMTHGVPVLVPEVMLEEASEVIADRENAEDFGPEEDEDDEDDDDYGLEEEIDPSVEESFDEDDDFFIDLDDGDDDEVEL